MLPALPDFRMTINDMLPDGDKVVTYRTGRATNTGEFMGVPATAKPWNLRLGSSRHSTVRKPNDPLRRKRSNIESGQDARR